MCSTRDLYKVDKWLHAMPAGTYCLCFCPYSLPPWNTVWHCAGPQSPYRLRAKVGIAALDQLYTGLIGSPKSATWSKLIMIER